MGISSGNGEGFADLVQQNLLQITQLLQSSKTMQLREDLQGDKKTEMLRLRANALGVEDLLVRAAIARVKALKYEAECQKSIAEQQELQYSQLRSRLAEIEGDMYTCLDELGGIKKDVKAKVNALAEQTRNYQKMEQEATAAINNLKDRINRASEKKKKAETWYYMLIPGYNIYLVADAYTDEDVTNLQNLKSRCEQISSERQRLESELCGMERQLEADNTELGRCTNELVNIQRSILRCIEDIGNCGKELAKWNDLYLMYGKIEQDIRNKGMKSEYAMKQIYV